MHTGPIPHGDGTAQPWPFDRVGLEGCKSSIPFFIVGQMGYMRTLRRGLGLLLVATTPVSHLILVAIAVTLAAFAAALWEGARPQVVAFGRDACIAALATLRRRLRLAPGGARHSGRQPPTNLT